MGHAEARAGDRRFLTDVADTPAVHAFGWRIPAPLGQEWLALERHGHDSIRREILA
jgi:hypothetical protein